MAKKKNEQNRDTSANRVKRRDITRTIMDRCLVPPGKNIKLSKYDPAWMGPQMKALGTDELKQRSVERLEEWRRELTAAQEVLYADGRFALLIVFQASDAAGKDGTIKHVMKGVNPQGCQVSSFKQPSKEDLSHNFLWRYSKALPERGRIGIFNRSYYEDVLITRVRPELLAGQTLPKGGASKAFWEDRYEDIRNFEKHLTRNGTAILKFFLNVSRKEQKRRFLERLEMPAKNWKFSASDLRERALWDDYQSAYEKAMSATSTEEAPWFVIPADRKWIMRAAVSLVIVERLNRLGLRFPVPGPQQKQQLAEALAALRAE